MKRILVLALALALTVAALASCSCGGNTDDSNATTTLTGSDGQPISPTPEGFTEINDIVYVNSAMGLNVRSTPDASNANNIVGSLAHGKDVARTGINEASGWSRILYNGAVAYVKTEFLSSTVPEAVTTVVTDTDVPADQFVECNETVYVFPTDDNGKYVSTGEANYYSAANRDKWAGALKAGEQLTRVAKTTEDAEGNGWSKLAYKDKDGKDIFIYMRNSVVTTTNPATGANTTTAAQ